MKINTAKISAILATMMLAFSFAGCYDGHSDEDEKNPEGFVKVPAVSIKGDEIWTPASEIFVNGRVLNLKALYMSDHEVTQAEWNDVMGTVPDEMAETDGNADNNPVNCVRWYDALVYCNKRSINEGLTPCYTINGSTDPKNWGGKYRHQTIIHGMMQSATLKQTAIVCLQKQNGNGQHAADKNINTLEATI